MKKYLWILLITGFISAGMTGTLLAAPDANAAPEQKTPPTSGKGENVEALFQTLNDTLEENRKIHATLKDLQTAYQKKTLENEDLKSQMKKVEALAIDRTKELSARVSELEKQLSNSHDSMRQFEQDKSAFDKEKGTIEDQFKEISAENAKLKKLLSTSVLEGEKDELYKIAKNNNTVANETKNHLSKLSNENQEYRGDLASAYFEMGNVHFQNKRYPEAMEAYKKAVSFDPTNAWAYYNLAVIEDYYMDDPKSAYEHYQRYLNYKPMDEAAEEVRRRILDLNMLQKIAPDNPLSKDFDAFHHETRNAKY